MDTAMPITLVPERGMIVPHLKEAIMTTCVPIRALKDTGAFAKTVEEAGEPVHVTRNGEEAFVVMTSEAYDAMKYEIAKNKLLERLRIAEAEHDAGEYVDGWEFIAEVREHYGI